MKLLHTIIGIGLLLLVSACGMGPAEKPPYDGIKLGKPYEISGRWYKPHYDVDYDEIGKASWYGPGFHGGKTASGEPFDQEGLTAAHKTLPMPSIVRVTNLDNGKSAIVKINDRGPFAHDRIIDLSRGAAVKLGVIRTGTAKVRVQFLDQETRDYVQNLQKGRQYAMRSLKKVNPDEAAMREEIHQEQAQQSLGTVHSGGPPVPGGTSKDAMMAEPETSSEDDSILAKPTPEAPLPWSGKEHGQAQSDPFSVVDNANAAPPDTGDEKTGKFFVQAATFKAEENAQRLQHKLGSIGSSQIIAFMQKDRKLYRVVLGPYIAREDAKKQLSKLAAIGISNATIYRN